MCNALIIHCTWIYMTWARNIEGPCVCVHACFFSYRAYCTTHSRWFVHSPSCLHSHLRSVALSLCRCVYMRYVSNMHPRDFMCNMAARINALHMQLCNGNCSSRTHTHMKIVYILFNFHLHPRYLYLYLAHFRFTHKIHSDALNLFRLHSFLFIFYINIEKTKHPNKQNMPQWKRGIFHLNGKKWEFRVFHHCCRCNSKSKPYILIIADALLYTKL